MEGGVAEDTNGQTQPVRRDLEEVIDELEDRIGDFTWVRLRDQLDEKIVRRALQRANGNHTEAATKLGMTRRQIEYRIRRYKIS